MDPVTDEDKQMLYGWSYGKSSSSVICPQLGHTLAEAQELAEQWYVKRDRQKYPGAAPQRLEWREHTSPRGYGFGGRFWALYAERRAVSARRYNNEFAGAMFRTDYQVSEMWLEG